MNANELKLAQAKLQATSKLWDAVFGTVRFIALCLTIVAAFWAILTGLKPLLEGQSAESIGAIAKVIQAMNLGTILGYGWGVVATGGWMLERSRKPKRPE